MKINKSDILYNMEIQGKRIYSTIPSENPEKSLLHKRLRFGSCLFLGVLIAIITIELWFKVVIYLTNWGIIFTFTYFTIASLSYNNPNLAKPTKRLFEISWGLNWTITLIYWIFVFPNRDPANNFQIFIMVLLHTTPVLLSIIDYFMNSYLFKRKSFLIPLGVLSIYVIFNIIYVNITGAAVYPKVNYQNYFSFIVIFFSYLIMTSALELGNLFKSKLLSNNKKQQIIKDTELLETISH